MVIFKDLERPSSFYGEWNSPGNVSRNTVHMESRAVDLARHRLEMTNVNWQLYAPLTIIFFFTAKSETKKFAYSMTRVDLCFCAPLFT